MLDASLKAIELMRRNWIQIFRCVSVRRFQEVTQELLHLV